ATAWNAVIASVPIASANRLESPGRDREIVGVCCSADVRVELRVNGNVVGAGLVGGTDATKISGIDQRRAGGVEFGNKDFIGVPGEFRAVDGVLGREVYGIGKTGHVNRTLAIHGDPLAVVVTAASE